MMLRYVFLALVIVAIAVVAIAGPRGHHFNKPPFEVFPDMNYQDNGEGPADEQVLLRRRGLTPAHRRNRRAGKCRR